MTTTLPLPDSLQPLRTQILAAAAAFASEAQPLAQLLQDLVADVDLVMAEPLEIFPVCHHSPASAVQLVQRLRQNPPQVIYLELCEDLRQTVESLQDCKLPVALQAFSDRSEVFAPEDLPLSVIAPLTEASAEYQAIAFCLQSAGTDRPTELVFVDRSAELVVAWKPDRSQQGEAELDVKQPPEEADCHGGAIAVEIGRLTPSFDEFLEILLKNSQTRHFSEWWDQYVEQALIGADWSTYRQVMTLVGSLIRSFGVRPELLEVDRQRESYMWTRIKAHLAENQIQPQDALFICGAAHAASDVLEFGVDSPFMADIPEPTATHWLYGLIPSSFLAIEYQFSHAAGTLSLAEATWKKSLKLTNNKPFLLRTGGKTKKAKKAKSTSVSRRPKTTKSQIPDQSDPGSAVADQALVGFLTRSPEQAGADTEQLLHWCSDIVGLARRNGYLASTADAIAIYETAQLLANLRQRAHPSPYDFQDAAITCLEKDRTPKKRNIQQLCQILMGGDRQGTVGYSSLPPLAQNVYDRLAPLNLNLSAKTNQRALMDFQVNPDLLACSDVIWLLYRLLGDAIVHPIMGERKLGHTPLQESWELRIGKYQGQLIQLGYQGVTLEQVLEQTLKRQAFAPEAKAAFALAAAEDSLLFLHHPHLTSLLGEQAVRLLVQETGVEDATQIFQRVRRLVQYYRTQNPSTLPPWLQAFVATGYRHYSTLLPFAFGDRGTHPEQIAAMLGFIFTLESLALSLGCQRSQLYISVQQAADQQPEPAKLGLLWTTEWLLKQRDLKSMGQFFENLLRDPLRIETFADYLSGYILALQFAPRVADFVVQLLNQFFGSVPDAVLLPQLPNLILKLRAQAQHLKPLVKTAARSFPQTLADLDALGLPAASDLSAAPELSTPPFEPALTPKTPTLTPKTISIAALSEADRPIQTLLLSYPATAAALTQRSGISGDWSIAAVPAPPTPSSPLDSPQSPAQFPIAAAQPIQSLLTTHPTTLTALLAKLKS